MYIFVVALHIFVSLILVLVIIMQPGKGGDMGGGFGGGAATAIFGPQGPTNLLQRATTVCAALFIITSVTLAWYSDRETLANADVRGALQEQQEKRKEREAKEKEKEATLQAVPGAEGVEPIELTLPPDGAPPAEPTEPPAEGAPKDAP